MKIKVLLICPNGEFGGAERTAITFASGLIDHNVSCTVALLRQGAMEESLKSRSIPYIITPMFRLSRPNTWLQVFKFLSKYIKENKINLIHSEMAYAHLIGSFLAIFHNIPCCWYQHGPVDRWSIMQWISAILPSTGFITNSKYTESCQPLHFLFGKKIIIPPALEEIFLTSQKNTTIRTQLSIPADGTVILLPGRFQRKFKGQDFAIDSFYSIATKYPNSYLLLLGAPNNSSHRDYNDYLKILNLANIMNSKLQRKAIHVLPFDTNIIPYLDSADIVINTSQIPEPFGCTLIEAMSRGCITVTSDCGGSHEIISNSKNGFIYRFKSKESLGAVLENIINNKQKLTLISEQAKEDSHLYSRFSASKHLVDFYQNLISK